MDTGTSGASENSRGRAYRGRDRGEGGPLQYLAPVEPVRELSEPAESLAGKDPVDEEESLTPPTPPTLRDQELPPTAEEPTLTPAALFELEHQAGLKRFFERKAEEESKPISATVSSPRYRLPEFRTRVIPRPPHKRPELPREVPPPTTARSIFEEEPRDRQNGCWICGRRGHKHRYYTAPDTTYCFRCGRLGYTIQSCPKCGQD